MQIGQKYQKVLCVDANSTASEQLHDYAGGCRLDSAHSASLDSAPM